jgi:hypothetical protein
MIMKLKEEARAHGDSRASEKKSEKSALDPAGLERETFHTKGLKSPQVLCNELYRFRM